MESRGVTLAISLIVYLVLSIVLGVLLYEGPYKLYRRNDTTTVTDDVELTSLWPDFFATVVACSLKTNEQKLEEAGQSVTQEAIINVSHVFQSYVENEDNWQPSNFIKALMVVEDSIDGTVRHMNLSMFRPVLVDFTRFGICWAFDIFDLQKNDPNIFLGRTTHLAFWLQANASNPKASEQTVFAIFPIDTSEELMLSGPVAMAKDTGVAFIHMRPGEGIIYHIGWEKQERMRKCSPDNVPLSACVGNWLDHKFGQCREPWSKEESSKGLANCTIHQLTSRGRMLEYLKMDSLHRIEVETGCLLPCHRMHYTATELGREKHMFAFPSLMPLVPEADRNTSAFLMTLIPFVPSVRRTTEVLNYPMSSVIGEVGGYFGLFLGLSLWGIFEFVAEGVKMAAGYISNKSTFFRK